MLKRVGRRTKRRGIECGGGEEIVGQEIVSCRIGVR